MTQFEWLQKMVADALANETRGCVIWPFPNKNPYPVCKAAGKQIGCHRYACEARHGPAPDDGHTYIDAAHSCGVKQCVSPWCLEWKTRQENITDNIAQGKMLHGSKIGVSKLVEENVEAILNEYASGVSTQQELADRYEVTNDTISLITSGKIWLRVKGPRTPHPSKDWNQGSRHFNAKLVEEDVRSIKTRKKADPTLTAKVFAKEYGVNPRTITDIFEDKTWRHVAV